MSWNYRVIKYDENDDIYYNIHEVYYDDKGMIEGLTEDPINPTGESLEELINDLNLMLKDALKYKVLSYKKLNDYFIRKDKTMANGKKGDHPYTDITVHKIKTFSDEVDRLILKIIDYGYNCNDFEKLFDWFNPPPVNDLELILQNKLEELKIKSEKKGWENKD